MAIVFKFNYQNSLRRWIASDVAEEAAFSVTLEEVEGKIRELFGLPSTARLVLTYIDRDNDAITVGDDKDLKDACFVQRLNPLRLEVRVLEERGPACEKMETRADASESFSQNPLSDVESLLRSIFPQATLENIKRFTNSFAPDGSLKCSLEELPRLMEQAFKCFLEDDSAPIGQQKTGRHKHGCDARFERDADKCSGRPGPYSRKRGGKDFCGPYPAVHHRVQCDGCGVQPIEGIRYKSTKLHDYDLCAKCFEANGKEDDFQKIEHPMHSPCSWQPRPWMMGRGFGRPPFAYGPHGAPFTRGPFGWRPECALPMGEPMNNGKLDARFVRDVSIFDGTELAPGTKFTKIWRLRNSGTLRWPEDTQLVHIGGDKLSTYSTTGLELPDGGLSPDEEVDASLDLVAPERAGRYVSYWRLATPLGQKFGHRMWVEIQVVPQGEESPQLRALLRQERGMAQNGLEVVNNDKLMADVDGSQGQVAEGGMILDIPVVNDDKVMADVDGSQGQVAEGGMIPVNNASKSLLEVKETSEIGSATKDSLVPVDSGYGDHRTPGFQMGVMETPTGEQEVFPDVVVEAREVDGFAVVETPVDGITAAAVGGAMEEQEVGNYYELQTLESCGFTNRELNALLLAKNDGDVQQTLESLVSVAWDVLLNDLEEMGFRDQVTNMKLLVKHNGSLKAAVKELVHMGR